MKERTVWRSDVTWYTIVHRRPFERLCYSFGYRTNDINLLRELAEKEVEEGTYSCVKIINANTNEDFEYFTKAHR